jgi:hypothetical protein
MSRQKGDPTQIFSEKNQERFWQRVFKTDSCWLWTLIPSAKGYGRWTVEGRKVFTHRYAWTITNGPIPDFLRVLHTCDNPPCVNPDHLWLGTDADNGRDKKEKGRAAKGENNGRAKITIEIVDLIRSQYKTGNYSHRSLAKKYSLSKTEIGHIIREEKWRMTD